MSTESLDQIKEKIHPESRRFLDLCEEIMVLHLAKAEDYGSGRTSLGNFDMAEEFGVTPEMGCFIRMGDKFARLASFTKKGKLKNEGVEDTLRDIAVYSLIGIVLLERKKNGSR